MYKIGFKDNIVLDNGGLVVGEVKANHYVISGLLDGEYSVRVYAGDLNDDGDVSLHVILNNNRQVSMWVNDRQINFMDYDVSVIDGKIEAEFFGKYVCIQGINIARKIKDMVKDVCVDVKVTEDENVAIIKFDADDMYSDFNIYKEHIGSGKDIIKIGINGNVYEDRDVLLGEEYTYVVKIVDGLGFESVGSEKINVCIKDAGIEASPVRDLKVKSVDGKMVSIKWDEPINADVIGARAYNIYRKTPICNYKFIGTVNAKDDLEFVDDTVITDRVFTYGVEVLSFGGKSEIVSADSTIAAPIRKRQMEYLDRGAIAIRIEKGMFIAYRLNGWECVDSVGFNIYADGVKINSEVLYGATNYIDKDGNFDTKYVVKKVVDGMEEKDGYEARNLKHNYLDVPINKPEDYIALDGNKYSYTANDASVADLDGDGEYEIILKWDCNGKDNSHKGYTGNVYIDAYKLDGTMLWRVDLGKNIRCGAHYTQFMVYDFDGDGYAEMIVKTADGTKDALGNVVGDEDVDYRNKDGFIIEGPEYLSLIDGRNGAIIDTVEYDPPRGDVSQWGDSWGNRVDRFLACVAYLDGVHPSVVMCRGYYDHKRPTNLVAYDVVDKKLVKRWKFRADATQNVNYTNQGFHNLAVGDVDGDGCDEIVYGACVIDHDGTGLYSTGLEHGDAMHLGRFTNHSEGMDYFGIHEHADCPYGMEARNAGTGEITFGKFIGRDTGRGLCAKIDPRYDGNQMWSYFSEGLYNYEDGKKITKESPESVNFAIWWDGDLLRELLDHDWYGYETNVGIPKIYKWNWENDEMDIIMSTDNVLSNNGTKGNPCLQASIFGDWREEAIFRGKDSTFLRIYTTTDFTEHRFYTFMHDYVYRLSVAWQNTAYNQPPQTSFYIGPDMKEVPIPSNTYIKAGV